MSVAVLLLGFISSMRACLAIILSRGADHIPGCLLATTTLLAAMRPLGPLANAIDRACTLVALLSVGAVVTARAVLTTVLGRAGDAEGLLLDTVSAGFGALGEL